MQILVKIATLKGVFIEKEVPMVILPASDGEVGIMASHVPFIFKLNNGLVKLYDTNSTERIFLFGGFSQVYENKVDILTDKAINPKELDIKFAQEQILSLEDQLLSSGDEKFLLSVQKDLDLYRKILEASEK